MYEKVNITANFLLILSLFTNGYSKEYYIREVQKLLNVSPRTAQLILEDLEKKAVLESKIKGKIKAYKIKKSDMAIEYLIMTEHYKKICFLKKHLLIREIASKAPFFSNGIVAVFGSYAKGIEKKDSDIDVFIAGNYNNNEVKKISKLYGIEINVKNYSLSAFEKSIANDSLLKEIIRNHIILSNAESFVRLVLKNGQT